MVALVFPALPTVTLAVTGRPERFPVRRIFCVGRNYAEHAREMGAEPEAEPPFFFTKPADAVVESGSRIPYPPATTTCIMRASWSSPSARADAMVSEEDADALIWGHAAGNDLTRRDLQAEAKAARRPWDMAKGFDKSAVVGAIRPGRAAQRDAALFGERHDPARGAAVGHDLDPRLRSSRHCRGWSACRRAI